MKKAYEFLCKAELLAAKYILFSLTFLVFAAAVMRTFRHPINWAIDFATFLFAWCVFIGGDIAVRQDKLFCITLLTAKLPNKVQAVLKVVNYLIISAFLAGMIGYGVYLSYLTRLRTFQGIPGFSYTWVTLSIPAGCGLMLISSILKIRNHIKEIQTGAFTKKEEGITEVI